MKFSDLLLRTFTGAGLALVLLFCLVMGGFYAVILFSLIGAFLLWEWLGMKVARYQPAFRRYILTVTVFVCYFGLIAAYLSQFSMYLSFLVCFWVLGIAGFFMRDYWAALGLFYAVLPTLAALHLIFMGDLGVFLLLFLFLILWATDVFAYFTGRLVGGPKLAPKLSPNKTWSGAAGGVLGSMLVMGVVTYQFEVADYMFLSGKWVFVIFLSVVSQFGDLFESWLKRLHGVKDSGRLLPGHGGFMDRFDGFVPSVLCLLVAVSIFTY